MKPKEEIKNESYDFIKGLYHYLNINVCCEECSTPDHPIFMNQVEGINFYCPVCKKEVMILINPVFNFGGHWSPTCERCQELEKKGISFGRKKE